MGSQASRTAAPTRPDAGAGRCELTALLLDFRPSFMYALDMKKKPLGRAPCRPIIPPALAQRCRIAAAAAGLDRHRFIILVLTRAVEKAERGAKRRASEAPSASRSAEWSHKRGHSTLTFNDRVIADVAEMRHGGWAWTVFGIDGKAVLAAGDEWARFGATAAAELAWRDLPPEEEQGPP
jgi:hypothetical protein